MCIGALLLVTGEAHFSLRLSVAHLVYRRMNFVAAVAGHLVALMLTATPVRACGTLMAGQANVGTCSFIGNGIDPFFEYDIR